MYTFNAVLTLNWELFSDAAAHLILPAIALGTIPLAIIARITRSSLLDVLGLDYVRTARAKGLQERGVVLGHALRNALLPVVTIIGLQLGGLLSGAVLTETIFRLGGMGTAIFEAIEGRDYAVIQGFTVVVAVGLPGREPAGRPVVRQARPADPAAHDLHDRRPHRGRDRREAGRRLAAGRHAPRHAPPAERHHRPGRDRLPRLRRHLRRRHRPIRRGAGHARHRSDRQGALGPVHPPAGLPGGPDAAPHGARRQRPRRLQPGRLSGRASRSRSASSRSASRSSSARSSARSRGTRAVDPTTSSCA